MLALNDENIELYIMMLVDDELDKDEIVAVLDYIKHHQQWEAVYLDFQSLKVAAEVMIFDQRDSLIKEDETKSVIIDKQQVTNNKKTAFVPWKSIASIAAVFAIGVGVYWWNKDETVIVPNNTVAMHQDEEPMEQEEQVTAPQSNSLPVVKDNRITSVTPVIQTPKRNRMITATNTENNTGADRTHLNVITENPNYSNANVVATVQPDDLPNIVATVNVVEPKIIDVGSNTPMRRDATMPLLNKVDKIGILEELDKDLNATLSKVSEAIATAKKASINIKVGNKSFKIK